MIKMDLTISEKIQTHLQFDGRNMFDPGEDSLFIQQHAVNIWTLGEKRPILV